MNAKITTLVRDHEFSAIIGMLDFERVTPQKIRINAEFKSENFIDYVEVVNFIEEFYGEQKFQSIENSVSRTAQALKAKFPSLTALNFEILKTEIIKNALVGAKIEIVY